MSKKFIIGGYFFLLLYSIFWVVILHTSQQPLLRSIPQEMAAVRPSPQSDTSKTAVLASEETIPSNAYIPLPPRSQAFSLSCEFAAASAIIHFFTKDDRFSPTNEKDAEKILMSTMTASANPNIGIRMGTDIPEDEQTLYRNLNKWFGGTDYYGIHAPPFLDLFTHYKLTAKPIGKNGNSVESIAYAVSHGHLVMAWIELGSSQPKQIPLPYGTDVSVIPGEHVVVINGYDSEGVYVMDPALGKERYIDFTTLLKITDAFPMPFLEVSDSQGSSYFSLDTAIPLANIIGIDRKLLRVKVVNASHITGKGEEVAGILQDFGYHVVALATQEDQNSLDISITTKKDKSDYLYLLKKDLTLSSYTIATTTAELEANDNIDAVIIVGN